MKEKLIRVIECPKCGSENFHGREYVVDKHNMDNGVLWGLYCCNDCGTDFDVKYIANDIDFANPEDIREFKQNNKFKNNIIKFKSNVIKLRF